MVSVSDMEENFECINVVYEMTILIRYGTANNCGGMNERTLLFVFVLSILSLYISLT